MSMQSEALVKADIELRHVQKSFGSVDVIHGLDLTINGGEFVVFVGPSGCGKSTLLRMIAGLEEVTDGDILIGGRAPQESFGKAAGRRGHGHPSCLCKRLHGRITPRTL